MGAGEFLGFSLWRGGPSGLQFDRSVEMFEATDFVSGDFDGDGRLDLMTGTRTSADSIGMQVFWRGGTQ